MFVERYRVLAQWKCHTIVVTDDQGKKITMWDVPPSFEDGKTFN